MIIFVICGQSWKVWLWKSLNVAIFWDWGSNSLDAMEPFFEKPVAMF
jgi:hypothetical protein